MWVTLDEFREIHPAFADEARAVFGTIQTRKVAADGRAAVPLDLLARACVVWRADQTMMRRDGSMKSAPQFRHADYQGGLADLHAEDVATDTAARRQAILERRGVPSPQPTPRFPAMRSAVPLI